MQCEESGVGESQGNAAVEWAMLGDRVDDGSFVHAAQDFYDVKFEIKYWVRVFAVEYSAQFVDRVQHSRTVYVLRNGPPHERKLSPRCGGEKIETKV